MADVRSREIFAAGLGELTTAPTPDQDYVFANGARLSLSLEKALENADVTDDFPADSSTTGVFASDGSASGVSNGTGDVDWFAAPLVAGELIVISSPNSMLRINFYNAAGELQTPSFFAVDDQATGRRYYGFRAPTDGTYYVATNLNQGDTVAYTLSATFTMGAHPYELSNAPLLANGSVLSGIGDGNDWFAIDLGANETIHIDGHNLPLALYDEYGDWISFASSGTFTSENGGRYYLLSYATHPYNFTAVIYGDDYGEFGSNEPMGVLDPAGDSIVGLIEASGDEDWFAINLDYQQAVTITLPFNMELHGPNGFFLAPNTGTLNFSALVAGTYYVVASAPANTHYTVSVAPLLSDDYSADFSHAGQLVSGAFSGALEARGDVDRFTFSGTAGQVLRLNTPHSNAGYIWDIELYAPSGALIEGNWTTDQFFTLFALPETGVYSVRFVGSPAASAPYHYSISASLIPHYEIPDAVAFMFDADKLLWTPIVDPGPTPTGPDHTLVVGQFDGMGLPILNTFAPATIGASEIYFSQTVGNSPARSGGLEFAILPQLTNHGVVWSQTATQANAITGFWEFANDGQVVAIAPYVAWAVSMGIGVFTNYGDIFAVASSGPAYGVSFAGTANPGYNEGHIFAWSGSGNALGVVFTDDPSEFENHGLIEAYATGPSAGVSFAWGGTLLNTGTIIARSTETTPWVGEWARGVYSGQLFDLTVLNAGIIDAPIAIEVQSAVLHLNNASGGLIIGDVIARPGFDVGDGGFGGDDDVINDGVIDGSIFLNGGADLYDGYGIVTGVINLGAGADIALGGEFSDYFIGGAGDDALDGYGGIDISGYGSISSTTASWHRNANGTWTVTSADGIDTLRSVEVLQFDDRDVFLDRAANNFSGDGTSDILLRRFSDGVTAIWSMNGATVTGSGPTQWQAGSQWSIQAIGDFDANGRDDFLLRRTADGVTAVWSMNGANVEYADVTTWQAGLEWTIQGAGDFNGDGNDDILWRRTDGVTAIWQLNGTAIAQADVTQWQAGNEWSIDGIGDFNGDGRDDILWRRTSDGVMSIWMMNGPNVQSADVTSQQAGLNWSIAGVGDFNGDGRDDLLIRNTDGVTAVWTMNGTGVLSATLTSNQAGNDWSIAAVGDYNGDGRDDILLSHVSGYTAIWTMNGALVETASLTSQQAGTEWGFI